MRISFYAPLKSPDHHVPSGDRQMARALIKALEIAGHEVELVSHLRSFSPTPHKAEHRDAAVQNAREIISNWNQNPPDLWFSYHPYYKSPDFLALEVLKYVPLPVVTVEASLAGKRDLDEWRESQQSVRDLLQAAKLNFYFTDCDMPGLLTQVPREKLLHLPPFIDTNEAFCENKASTSPAGTDRVQLVAMGMMRKGVKIDSYALLAAALMHIKNANWHLSIIGNGKERAQVESLFSSFPTEQITWRGEVASDDVAPLLTKADIFVWPGFGEAYGLAYLEAQSVGLPVVAQNTHGVPFVVEDGETGILVAPDDDKAYAAAVLKLIEDKDLRELFGQNASNFVHKKRNLENASKILDDAIRQVV